MTKPILLLDFDGVLSVVDSTSPARMVQIETSLPGLFRFYPLPTTRPFMEMAWRRFDVRWLTSLRHDSNFVARWAGLEDRPVIDGRGGMDWKVGAVTKALEAWQGPVAWIEDGLSPEAKEIVAARGWTFFRTDTFTGVTEEHIHKLEEFADRWTT